MAAPEAAQLTELNEKPMPVTTRGNAATEHNVTLQQRRKWGWHGVGGWSRPQAVGAGTPPHSERAAASQWVQVTLGDSFFPTPQIAFQIKSDFNEHHEQP